MTQPEFLGVDDVLLIHAGQLARYGGAAGIRGHVRWSICPRGRLRDGGRLRVPHRGEPAVRRCNKRTGVLAAVVFLELNGYFVEEPPSRFYEAMIAIAEHRLDKNGLAAMLREMSRPVGGGVDE